MHSLETAFGCLVTRSCGLDAPPERVLNAINMLSRSKSCHHFFSTQQVSWARASLSKINFLRVVRLCHSLLCSKVRGGDWPLPMRNQAAPASQATDGGSQGDRDEHRPLNRTKVTLKSWTLNYQPIKERTVFETDWRNLMGASGLR